MMEEADYLGAAGSASCQEMARGGQSLTRHAVMAVEGLQGRARQ